MQTLGRGVRSALAARQGLTAQPTASSSRVQWDARRNISFPNIRPVEWIRKRLETRVMEAPSEEELARTRKAEGGVFDDLEPDTAGHKYSTANFKISHRKLNDLGRQISGKPIDYAILQMKFSEKRASKRIKSMLVVAKNHAVAYKGLDEKKLVVSEAWVAKGPRSIKRVEIKGRGKHGIRTHPDSKLNVVLREGKTWAEKVEQERARKLRKIVSAGITREDKPLRNPGAMWAW
ncbi:mitochondrial 50S ribosomal protein L22 [Punctularia strigosozonata HHB-11173 SS5]|uniref:mitochondrial 50S ribosomal protein L22 n=1 Tax=Punctularia strigosozonata (strain HHB-11173) TaxID=741275 RepID=UPI00044180A3|nr:mitochondrial 50S ribosomal protein L22 [Punctularia strigosozonata HHB-11173 SS5]EIN10743.1 mitochondrial 50S ribosomal protein L22 [Punctularia strigosozonata HHB-11173 SS5]